MAFKFSEKVEDLLKVYRDAKAAMDLAHKNLREAAEAEFYIKVGDAVQPVDDKNHRIGKSKSSEIGRVTGFQFDVDGFMRDGVSLTPVVYPIKKDGTTADKGKWVGHRKLRVVTEPEPESVSKKRPAEEHSVNDGITRSIVKWPTKSILKTYLVHNASNLAELGETKVLLSKGEHGTWQVVKLGDKTDPGGPWYNHGHKTFHTYAHIHDEQDGLTDAMKWAKEKFGIDHWVRDPYGSWQTPDVYDHVMENMKKPKEGK